MKEFKDWKDIRDWARAKGYAHMADRIQLNNDCWYSSGEFGRSQVAICDAMRFAKSEKERKEIAEQINRECKENYGLYGK